MSTAAPAARRAEMAHARAEARLAAVVAFVGSNPGCGVLEVRKALLGRNAAADEAIAQALHKNLIHDRGTGGPRARREFHPGPRKVAPIAANGGQRPTAPIPAELVAEVLRLGATGQSVHYVAAATGLDVRAVLAIQAGGRP